MKKTYKINGMNCNACAMLIEEELKNRVKKISVDFAREKADMDFDEKKIGEKEIFNIVNKLGFDIK